jgi:cytochrome b
MKKIRVWDLPLRLFHWSLVIVIVAAVVAQKIGGDAMVWHFRCGYAALTLVLFRILWGFFGPEYARFTNFMVRPRAVAAYVHDMKNGLKRPGKAHSLGHNPVGGWSVIALLAVVLTQAVSGLFSNDDIDSEGPLVKFISKALSDKIGWFHADVSGNVIYILIGLHLAAIAYYRFGKKENLIKPMILGDKEVDAAEVDVPAANDSAATRLLALVLLAVSGAVVYVAVTW